jgi:hypothetical protein
LAERQGYHVLRILGSVVWRATAALVIAGAGTVLFEKACPPAAEGSQPVRRPPARAAPPVSETPVFIGEPRPLTPEELAAGQAANQEYEAVIREFYGARWGYMISSGLEPL